MSAGIPFALMAASSEGIAKARAPIARLELAAWPLPACMTGSTRPSGWLSAHDGWSGCSVSSREHSLKCPTRNWLG